MVTAHSKTTEELGGIVASEKLKVELPSKLDAKHQKLIDDLKPHRTKISTRPMPSSKLTAIGRL